MFVLRTKKVCCMFVFDGHNDSLTALYQPPTGKERTIFEQSTYGALDLPRAKQGGFGGGMFAIFIPPPEVLEREPHFDVTFTADGFITALPEPIEQAYAQNLTDKVIDFAYRLEAESKRQIKVVQNMAALEMCFQQNVLALVLHLEGAEAIKPDLSNLEDYYVDGVRSLGIVWSRPNAFGNGVPFNYPSSPDTGEGLTEAGKALVRECNRLGILVDLAHLNERGFWDAAEITDAPLVVSHTAVHALTPFSRNLTDAQIDAVGASGGIIGMNFEAMASSPTGSVEQDVPLTQIAAHIDYIVQRIGIDHVGFGSDFDGADMPNDLSDVSKVPNLVQTLREGGYDEAALEKIAYGNWLRVLRNTWKD